MFIYFLNFIEVFELSSFLADRMFISKGENSTATSVFEIKQESKEKNVLITMGKLR